MIEVKTVSLYVRNESVTNSTVRTLNWNGRNVVIVDKAYDSKQEIQAGFLDVNGLERLFFSFIALMAVIPPLATFTFVTLSTGSSTEGLIGAGICLLVEVVIACAIVCNNYFLNRRPDIDVQLAKQPGKQKI